MGSADVRLVIGTRPEAIKLAPVAHALARHGLTPRIIFTGQHANLNPIDFRLEGFPIVDLHCPGLADPDRHVRQVAHAIRQQIEPTTDLVVVQGDTSSAVGGALGAVSANVALAHVEAGLRTHDLAMPWPEEGYRVAIDARGDLLFAPTELSAANLHAENVRGRVFVTGNTSIDALFAAIGPIAAQKHDRALPRLLVTCHRRENWGERLASITRALRRLANDGAVALEIVVPPNQHVAMSLRRLFRGARSANLLGPCSHAAMIQRLLEADIVLSDSGGLQEEATALGVPLLILRDSTERPEGLATGNMRIVGTNERRIFRTVRDLLADPASLESMRCPSHVYGDGRAADRIAAIIADWLVEHRGRVTMDVEKGPDCNWLSVP